MKENLEFSIKKLKTDLSSSWKFLQTQTFFLNLRISAIDRTNSIRFEFRFRSSVTSLPLPVNFGKIPANFSLTKSDVGSSKSSFRRSSESANPRMMVFGFIAPIPEIRTSCWMPSRMVDATVISTKAFTFRWSISCHQ